MKDEHPLSGPVGCCVALVSAIILALGVIYGVMR